MSNKVKNTILGLKIFHGCYTLLYGLIIASFCFIPFIISDMPQEESDPPLPFLIFCLGIAFLFVLAFFAAHFIAAVKASVQSRKMWILQIILVGVGLGSLGSMIPSIILMINLLSDEVQEYYKHPRKINS